jgi:type IV pilus assembly protein PilY1
MVSELLALSTQGTGYADRLYMGDTGGNMWRVNLSSTTPSAWTITKIFNSNPGYTGYPAPVSDGSRGRKIFYKPDGFIDATGVVRLYFGTGDREHPLNRAVTDRLYGLVDKGQAGAVSEANLIDVTTDQIQAGSQSVVDDVLAQLTKAGDPADTTVYGWYIQLNGADVTPYVQYPGEKVLAGAAVAGGAVYFTTYSPSSQQSLDPCQLGNLGSGSLFAVDPKLGSAVANFDTSNDGLYSSYSGNKYAVHGNDVLLRTDRRKNVGQSIASGPVVLFPPKQTCTTPPCPPPPPVCERILVGGGRGLSSNCGSDTPPRPVEPIYWRMR